MTENCNQDALLVTFLRGLADDLEGGNIARPQVQLIGEFFMSYQFRTQALKDNYTSLELGEGDFDQEDIVKFFVLGWFVYCVLMKDGTLPVPSCDTDEELEEA